MKKLQLLFILVVVGLILYWLNDYVRPNCAEFPTQDVNQMSKAEFELFMNCK